jgi:hypothetical protein
MAVFVDRIDAVPIQYNDFPYEFNQWLSVLVDSLNQVIEDISGLLISTDITTLTTQNVILNSLYIPTAAGLTTFQLPPTTTNDVGSKVSIAGQGAGGWKLLTGAGQTIQIRDVGAVANVSVASSNRYDSIELVLVAASTWITLSTQTTGFVIV